METYNYWSIIKVVGKNKRYQKIVLARCKCGSEKEVMYDNVRSGKSKSCGCHRKAVSKNQTHSKKHGDWNTRLYKTWKNMRQRCNKVGSQNYARYGGRGIKVCSEWDCYETFKKWALSHGYKDNLTIDRLDPNGNYEPSNCEWVTKSENSKRNALYHSKVGGKPLKLSAGDKECIRRLKSEGKSAKELAELYNISVSYVGIITRK